MMTQQSCWPRKRRSGPLSTLCELEENTVISRERDAAVMFGEVMLQIRVVIEPPQRWLWKNEKLCSETAQLLHLTNRVRAVLGVMACERPVGRTRKMPRIVPRQL